MDAFVKILYSLLFGILAYLLFLIFSEQVENKKNLEIGCLLIIGAIAAVNTVSIASHFVPSSEIWELTVFDFGIPILYVMMQRQSSDSESSSRQVITQNILSSNSKNFKRPIFLRVIITGIYVFQVISIWLLTERYIIESGWY